MSGEQWSEKDKAFIRDSVNDASTPYGEKIIIKQFTGVSDPGDPARGIQPKYSYKLTPVKAVVDSVTAQDVMYSGGLYLVGDIRVSLKQQLNFIDTIQQVGGPSQGDRIIYRGHEYRIVGRTDPETLIGNDRLFLYVFRKVGNA